MNPKRLLKRLIRTTTNKYIGTFHRFDVDMLKSALRELGVTRNQVVLVHSSFDAFRGFAGRPSDVVDALEDLVGPAGTVLMPSIPFTGTAIGYLKSGKITDIAKTPSRNGLLTEVFRRKKGTLRSVHPTHTRARPWRTSPRHAR